MTPVTRAHFIAAQQRFVAKPLARRSRGAHKPRMRIASCLFLLVVACTATPAPAPPRPEVVSARTAMAALQSQGFAGSALAACDDEVIFSGDYGVTDARHRTPSYWLASISKQFTAAAILKLAEAGRLSIDDPLSKYFPAAPRDKAAITLRQLMSHQSGLPQAYAADGVQDRDAAARAILASPLAFAPGSGFRYSNDNYSLLAMIVEMVSGQTFEDYERANIFAPAGLQHMGFWPEAGDDFVPPLLRMLNGPASHANWGFRGGTGMRASVRDLHAWTRALDRGAVLSPQSVALLYGPHTHASDGDGVGFGWFWSDIDGVRWLWTRGSEDFGANSIVYRRYGTPLTIIAATNAGPAEMAGPGWSRRVRDALMPIFLNACAAR